MTQPFSVHLDALTQYAKRMAELSEDFAQLRKRLIDADVTSDSFGALDESREAARVYAVRTDDGLGVLGTAQGVFGELADGIRQIRDEIRATDQQAANSFGG